MSKTIGIIGMGRMGMPAAKKYMREGYNVVGFDRRPDVIEEFKSAGGIAVGNCTEVAQKAGTVIIYVLNDQQVIEVVTGPNGILEGYHDQTKVICMSTIDKENLEWIAEQCAKRNVGFVDCPVTGGPTRVEAGTLTLIAATSKEFLEACRPILEVQGQIIYAGEKPGPRLVCQVVGSGICGSDYFRLVASSMLDNTPSPGGLGQMCKDIGLVINDSRRVQAPLIVANAASQYFLAALSLGMENADSSDLIKVLEKITNPDA
jgi:3-hydroxyisobutyrate dehydrogenase-like beta-hydroxyacid dehydrogenase